MGFMGMGAITDSDAASDFAHGLGRELARRMVVELTQDHGRWNTAGDINVALFFEEFIVESNELVFNDDLQKVARATRSKLKARAAFERKKKFLDFQTDYKRMICSLTKYINKEKL